MTPADLLARGHRVVLYPNQLGTVTAVAVAPGSPALPGLEAWLDGALSRADGHAANAPGVTETDHFSTFDSLIALAAKAGP